MIAETAGIRQKSVKKFIERVIIFAMAPYIIWVDVQTSNLKHQSGIFTVMHTHRCHISTSGFLVHDRFSVKSQPLIGPA